eukprot:6172015-Pleurochrysis_carterae.AAC.1
MLRTSFRPARDQWGNEQGRVKPNVHKCICDHTKTRQQTTSVDVRNSSKSELRLVLGLATAHSVNGYLQTGILRCKIQ